MEHLHDDLYTEGKHMGSLGAALIAQGAITPDQWSLAEKTYAPAGAADKEAQARPTETQTMQQILRGDLSALRRVLEEEERIRKKGARAGTER